MCKAELTDAEVREELEKIDTCFVDDWVGLTLFRYENLTSRAQMKWRLLAHLARLSRRCRTLEDGLGGVKDLKRQKKQMDTNFDFVFQAIETIHRDICTDTGTWQDRVKQVLSAVKKLSKDNKE